MNELRTVRSINHSKESKEPNYDDDKGQLEEEQEKGTVEQEP
jgi:hypothetical protein